jgi:NADPH2:quinone reductase
MLNRICIADGVKLVHIVRKPEQAALLREQGAAYVCDSSSPGFMAELTDAIAATGATLGFDAIGGGRLAGQILGAMEAAINRTAKEYSRYGSAVHKQVYVYGSLDPSPLEVVRNFGMAWGLGGWLLFPFLQKIGPADAERLRERVAAELKTTFASHYAREISLVEMLEPETFRAYGRRATGEKFLVNPRRDAAG